MTSLRTYGLGLFFITYFLPVKLVGSVGLDFIGPLAIAIIYILLSNHRFRITSRIFYSLTFLITYLLLTIVISFVYMSIPDFLIFSLPYAAAILGSVLCFTFVYKALSVSHDKILILSKHLQNIIVIMVLISAAWMVWQILTGNIKGHYGPVPIGMDNSSAVAGMFFFGAISFLLLLSFFSRSYITFFTIALSLVFGFMVGNRTFFLASIILLASFFMLSFTQRTIRNSIGSRVFFSLFFVAALLVLLNLDVRGNSFESLLFRFEVMRGELGFFDGKGALSILFGEGLGSFDAFSGKKVGMHSQFTRSLTEAGIFGVILLLAFFLYAAMSSFKSNHALDRVFFCFIISYLSTFLAYDSINIPRALLLLFIFLAMYSAVRRSRMRRLEVASPNP